jgi:hypothetical protein
MSSYGQRQHCRLSRKREEGDDLRAGSGNLPGAVERIREGFSFRKNGYRYSIFKRKMLRSARIFLLKGLKKNQNSQTTPLFKLIPLIYLLLDKFWRFASLADGGNDDHAIYQGVRN